MQTPTVLVLDDGELELVRGLLVELGAEFADVQELDEAEGLPAPERLLVTTARRADLHQLQRGVSSLSPRAVWLAFLDADAASDRAPLQLKGFDLVVREPVHPMAMRLLLQRALYRGDDKRQMRREAFGYQVDFHVEGGATAAGATLTDLSARGCRLFATRPPRLDARVRVRIPPEVADGEPLELPGTVRRSEPAHAEGGPENDVSVGIQFDTLEPELRKRLRRVLIERSSGPAVLPDAKRERREHRGNYGCTVMALAQGSAHALLGLDLSEGGMRVEPTPGLAVGDRLRLAIHPRSDPFLVEALVVRDDGERGLALRFEWVEPGAEGTLRELVRSLPMVEVLDSGQVVGTVVSQILQRGE